MVSILALAGCGEENVSSPESTGNKSSSGTNENVVPDISVADVPGERVDAGNISALCPEGWKSYPVADIFSDDDDAVDPDALEFRKGAESEDDKYLTPGLKITYYGEDYSLMDIDSENYFGGKFEVWGPVGLGGRTWEGLVGLENDEKFAIVQAKGGDDKFDAMIQLEDGGQIISLEDDDVLAILASIKTQ